MAQTDTPFVEELPRLLRQRGISVSHFASMVGVSQPHLSRVLRRADYKTPSLSLIRRAARALGLPAEYFPDIREAAVIAKIKGDPALRDRIFREISDVRPAGEVQTNS